MKTAEVPSGPVAPGLVQLDERTLVSVRLSRSAEAPVNFRAVALAVLRNHHRVRLASSLTVGFGPDPGSALEACLGRVKDTLSRRKQSVVRSTRRPEASL